MKGFVRSNGTDRNVPLRVNTAPMIEFREIESLSSPYQRHRGGGVGDKLESIVRIESTHTGEEIPTFNGYSVHASRDV